MSVGYHRDDNELAGDREEIDQVAAQLAVTATSRGSSSYIKLDVSTSGWSAGTAVGLKSTGWERAQEGTTYRRHGIFIRTGQFALIGEGAFPAPSGASAWTTLYLKTGTTTGELVIEGDGNQSETAWAITTENKNRGLLLQPDANAAAAPNPGGKFLGVIGTLSFGTSIVLNAADISNDRINIFAAVYGHATIVGKSSALQSDGLLTLATNATSGHKFKEDHLVRWDSVNPYVNQIAQTKIPQVVSSYSNISVCTVNLNNVMLAGALITYNIGSRTVTISVSVTPTFSAFAYAFIYS